MHRFVRWGALIASALALTAVAAQASSKSHRGWDRPERMLYATTSQNQLIKFNSRDAGDIRDIQAVTGLPAGVTLKGIDFQPATGDLYGVGSDSVVYRLNPKTGMGFLTNSTKNRGTTLYSVDPTTGKTRSLGRVGGGKRLVLTGLAAWQD